MHIVKYKKYYLLNNYNTYAKTKKMMILEWILSPHMMSNLSMIFYAPARNSQCLNYFINIYHMWCVNFSYNYAFNSLRNIIITTWA